MIGYIPKAIRVGAFLATIVGANWTLATFGIVPIGFGLAAPAGVFWAGLAFSARDALREHDGRLTVAVGIAVGCVLSFAIEDAQRFALASGVAFGLSEAADSLVYEPLRRSGRIRALACSNAVGLVVDSAVFLWLAFGSLAYIDGQLVGKLYMTALVIGILGARRAISIRRRAA
tara:strand:- start:1070 stop:1591 length:522 start_codon:yes stop_codon:yes gene_type:complete